MAPEEKYDGRFGTTIAKLLLLVILLTGCTLHGVEGACTLPDDLQGTWVDSTKGVLTFTNDSLSGYSIYLFGSFTLTCYNTTTESYYILESNSFKFFSLTFNGYFCWSFIKVTSDLYYFYEHGTPLVGAGNEKVRMYLPLTSRNVSEICPVTSPLTHSYRVLYRNATLSTSSRTCPSALQRYFTYDISASGTGVCSSNATLDVCTSTSVMQSGNSTNCTTGLGYSAGGELNCLFHIQSGSTYYLTVANKDATVDDSSTFAYTCMIIDTSSSPYVATQYPKQCPEEMNSTYVTSPGTYVSMSVTGTCPVASSSSSSMLWIIGVVMGILLLIGVAVLVWYLLYRRKKQKEKEREEKERQERERLQKLNEEGQLPKEDDDTPRGEFSPIVTNDKEVEPLWEKPGFRKSGSLTPSGLTPTGDDLERRFQKRKRVWVIGEDGKAVKVWKEENGKDGNDGTDGKDPSDSGVEDDEENSDKVDRKKKFDGLYTSNLDRKKAEKDFFKAFGRKNVKKKDELTDKGQLKGNSGKMRAKVKKMACVKAFTSHKKKRIKGGTSEDRPATKKDTRPTTEPADDSDGSYNSDDNKELVLRDEDREKLQHLSDEQERERVALETSGKKEKDSSEPEEMRDSALSSSSPDSLYSSLKDTKIAGTEGEGSGEGGEQSNPDAGDEKGHSSGTSDHGDSSHHKYRTKSTADSHGVGDSVGEHGDGSGEDGQGQSETVEEAQLREAVKGGGSASGLRLESGVSGYETGVTSEGSVSGSFFATGSGEGGNDGGKDAGDKDKLPGRKPGSESPGARDGGASGAGTEPDGKGVGYGPGSKDSESAIARSGGERIGSARAISGGQRIGSARAMSGGERVGSARAISGGERIGSARAMSGGERIGSARGMSGGERNGSARAMSGGERIGSARAMSGEERTRSARAISGGEGTVSDGAGSEAQRTGSAWDTSGGIDPVNADETEGEGIGDKNEATGKRDAASKKTVHSDTEGGSKSREVGLQRSEDGHGTGTEGGSPGIGSVETDKEARQAGGGGGKVGLGREDGRASSMKGVEEKEEGGERDSYEGRTTGTTRGVVSSYGGGSIGGYNSGSSRTIGESRGSRGDKISSGQFSEDELDIVDGGEMESATPSSKDGGGTTGKGSARLRSASKGRGTAWIADGKVSKKTGKGATSESTVEGFSDGSRRDASRGGDRSASTAETSSPSNNISSNSNNKHIGSRSSLGTTVSFQMTSEPTGMRGSRRSMKSSLFSSWASTRDDVTLPSMSSSGFLESEEAGPTLRSATYWDWSRDGSSQYRGEKSVGISPADIRQPADQAGGAKHTIQVTPRDHEPKDAKQRRLEQELDGQVRGTTDSRNRNTSLQIPTAREDSTLTAIDLNDPFYQVPALPLESSRPPTSHRRRVWQEGDTSPTRCRSPETKSRMERSQSERATESRSVHWQPDDEMSMPGTTEQGRRSVRWKPESTMGAMSVDSHAVFGHQRYPESEDPRTPSRESRTYRSMSRLALIHRRRRVVAPYDDDDDVEEDGAVDDEQRRRRYAPPSRDGWGRLLEELYPDKKYLDYAKASSKYQPDEEGYLHGKARVGLRYLYGRAMYWKTQKPLVRPGTQMSVRSYESRGTSRGPSTGPAPSTSKSEGS